MVGGDGGGGGEGGWCGQARVPQELRADGRKLAGGSGAARDEGRRRKGRGGRRGVELWVGMAILLAGAGTRPDG